MCSPPAVFFQRRPSQPIAPPTRHPRLQDFTVHRRLRPFALLRHVLTYLSALFRMPDFAVHFGQNVFFVTSSTSRIIMLAMTLRQSATSSRPNLLTRFAVLCGTLRYICTAKSGTLTVHAFHNPMTDIILTTKTRRPAKGRGLARAPPPDARSRPSADLATSPPLARSRPLTDRLGADWRNLAKGGHQEFFWGPIGNIGHTGHVVQEKREYLFSYFISSKTPFSAFMSLER